MSSNRRWTSRRFHGSPENGTIRSGSWQTSRPHCWKTGIGAAATAHLAAVSPNCRFIEFLPAAVADSQLRRELVTYELKIDKGRLGPLCDQSWGSISILTPFQVCGVLRRDFVHRDRSLNKYDLMRILPRLQDSTIEHANRS